MRQVVRCCVRRTMARICCAAVRPGLGARTILATCVLLTCPSALPQAPSPSSIQPHPAGFPAVHARLASGPIDIDGKLNEPDWQSAEPMLLTQQSPHPGQETPYRTDVRVLIYRDALIFGFHCVDPNPKAIQVHTLAQDGNQVGDDT